MKVMLRGSRPSVWRRFQVQHDITLAALHEILQAVMGWQNYHLYRVEIGGKKYGENDSDNDLGAGKVELCRVVPGEGARFLYAYDFGDNWIHTIEVERLLPPEQGVRTDEEYEETMRWLGGSYDPEEFDVDAVNAALRDLE